MSNALLDGLPNEPALQTNSLATVTASWILVRTAKSDGQTLISLASIVSIRRLKTTFPGLLVISAGLFLVAAAALASKQGEGAPIPLAVLAVAFLVFYFSSQRAALMLVLETETVETLSGTLREVASTRKAILDAQKRLQLNATGAHA